MQTRPIIRIPGRLREKKTIRIGFHGFWRNFSLESFLDRHPYLRLKYRFVETRNPDYQFVSVIKVAKGSKTVPDRAACNIFYSGENVEPDMNKYDYAISFSLMDHDRHFRMPCWIPRLYENGMRPDILLGRNRATTLPEQISSKFCNYIFSNRVAFRERFFEALNSRKPVTAPGRSCNNAPSIGPRVTDKIHSQRFYRFSIAFENIQSPGYNTEKIIESFVAGTVPIYLGDPNIADEFDTDSFVHIQDMDHYPEAIDEILSLENNPRDYLEKKNAPVFRNDTLPDCARMENALAFFEKIFG